MLSDEWLSRYGLLENFNASVTRTGTRTGTGTGTGTWTTGVTAIALCTSCSRAKKYHSAVPHENSAFKNFIHTCLMLNSENISYILCKISHLLRSIAIIQHVSAQITMRKRTISHRRLLFVHYPLLKSGPL